MKPILIPLALLLTACTTITYTDGSAEFARTSFGTQLQITELKATTDAHNNRTITLTGYVSDQVQALEKVAEGVAAGLAKGATP